MGNCVPSGGSGSGSCGAVVGAGRRQVQLQPRRSVTGEEEEEAEGVVVEAAPPPVVKLKMVLTKGELGWLVAQLKAGDRRLEDVLQEMARKREGRAAADGWRPSLESIVECPAETAAAASSDD